jgi:hypothetical protein
MVIVLICRKPLRIYWLAMAVPPILGGRYVLDGRKVVIFGRFISVELLSSAKTGPEPRAFAG